MPACRKVDNPVAADSAVDEANIPLGDIHADVRGEQVGVILTHDVVHVVADTLASAVGDRVTLKEDGIVLVQVRVLDVGRRAIHPLLGEERRSEQKQESEASCKFH